jgi:hypothetical protein
MKTIAQQLNVTDFPFRDKEINRVMYYTLKILNGYWG